MIQLYCVDLSDAGEEDYRRLYALASPQRQARADSFRRREDALRCVAADALLRRVLGDGYPRMERTETGKPFLPHRPGFHFNLSHSGTWAAIAWSSSPLGLDVQTLRPGTNMEAVARRYFAPEEQHYVFSEADGQAERFFEVWTGKESYVKYLGTGLNIDLTSFSVLSPDPGLHFHREILSDGTALCLCAREEAYTLELLDLNAL